MKRLFRRFLIARAIRRVLRGPGRAEARLEAHATLQAIADAPDAATTAQMFVNQVHSYGGLTLERLMRGTVKPTKAAPKPAPGRQPIQMPNTGQGIFGGSTWRGLIPAEAHNAPWENLHTFAEGERPKRDPYYGLGRCDPIAFVCPTCDLAQPPITSDERRCPYCGLHLRMAGLRLYWWRDQTEATAWPKALPKPEAGQ